MKEFIFKLFNPIPFKNRRIRIWVNQFISILIAILILFYQYLITDKVLEFDTISIYSNHNQKIDIHEITSRLQKNNIKFKKGVDVFFPISEKQYNFWTYYLYRGSLGVNQLIFNRIFINTNLPKTRNVQDIMLHELAHSYLKQEYGFFDALKMPIWKNEGFCEYIAETSTMEEKEGIAIFINKHKEDSLLQTNSLKMKQYQYFKYKLVFEYLIEKMEMSPKQIFEREMDIKIIETEIRKSVCPKLLL